ncbi:hypothetical protein JCM1840_002366 [Sporobolomyces johnsonii]
MASKIFEQWLIEWDVELVEKIHFIILLMDNFSGHRVPYQPKNIKIVFFIPNITAFVQPCDAGIIRTLKALYCRSFCERALDHDDAGEREIYKIDILEAMLLMNAAWTKVSKSTIANCWAHTGILSELPHHISAPVSANPAAKKTNPLSNPKAWDIILAFSREEISYLEAIKQLKHTLKSAYREDDWQPYLARVNMTYEEEDTWEARYFCENAAKRRLSDSAVHLSPSPEPDTSTLTLPQLDRAAASLQASITSLQQRNCIFGSALSVAEMISPDTLVDHECDQIGQAAFWFSGEELTDEELLSAGVRVLTEEEATEEEEDKEDEATSGEPSLVMLRQAQASTRQLEDFLRTNSQNAEEVELLAALRKLRGRLLKEEMATSKQATLFSFGVEKGKKRARED